MSGSETQSPRRTTAAGGGRLQPARAAPPELRAEQQPGPGPEEATPAASAVQPPVVAHQVAAGVRLRLQTLFERFLTGKVLGADLLTAEGEILAARDAEITYELVQKAEAAGLLPSLIAHMTLPGISEELEVRERGPGRPV